MMYFVSLLKSLFFCQRIDRVVTPPKKDTEDDKANGSLCYSNFNEIYAF